MFNSICSLSEAVKRFREVQDAKEFDAVFAATRNYFGESRLYEAAKELEKVGFYQKNLYSDINTNENAKEAAQRVIQYIEHLVQPSERIDNLQRILDNFDLFLECLMQHKPNAKASITDTIGKLSIENEYDLQHILYAFLKPIYSTERAEVNEDMGCGTVRADICIDQNIVIETKCTRKSMAEQKLREEISADITNYDAQNIYFYIYDKEKIIGNPQAFKQAYEAITKEKNIYVTIHQPKIL